MIKSKRRTAFLTTLVACLGSLLWVTFPYLKYDGRMIMSTKESQNSSLSNNIIAHKGNISHLLPRQYAEKTPLTHGTRSPSSKHGNSKNQVVGSYAFEPEIHEDFRTIDLEYSRIPHIMHFVFITGLNSKSGIPSIYKQNVLSYLQFNPNWTFYFWSDATGRELIAKRHPTLLSTYDKYKRVIYKANALRYILLYEFGGVYTDLDMKCMRPLDRATMKYACVLTPEPFEHSAILYKMPYFFSNAFMLCRPKHPFFKQMLESLPKTANLKDGLEVDGTRFFTRQFSMYSNMQANESSISKLSTKSNTPYFFLGESDHNDALYVANTQYFMSSFDFGASSQFKNFCRRYSTSYVIVKRGCTLWNVRKTNKTRNPFSFTDHNWKHMYTITRTTQMVPIQSVIPKIKQYNVSSDMLDV